MFKQENSKLNEHRKPLVASLNRPSGKSHAAHSWFVRATFPEQAFQSREGFNTLVELLWECENRFRDWEEQCLHPGETFTGSLPFQAGAESRVFEVTKLRSLEQAADAERLFRRTAIELRAISAQIVVGETQASVTRVLRSSGLTLSGEVAA